MVIVAAVVLSSEPAVAETTAPIEGVSFRSAGSMTGSRSSRPVRSVPMPPLMKSGPWMLFSWFSCWAKTWVSMPSTRLLLKARTQTVWSRFQVVESKDTGTLSE